MDSVPSRVEDILLALINDTEYDEPIISRVEQILYSFLENSEYAAEPESRVEAILVALKAAGLYDDEVISRIEKILYSKINGTEYTAEPESRIEELLLEWVLSEEKELTGVVPLLFNADGTPLLDYIINGNTVQNGTPTPASPIIPQETGDMTGNLWDEDYTGISGNLKYVPVLVGDGAFTLSTDVPDYSRNAPLFLLSGNVTSGASTPINGVYNGVSKTTDSSNGYITIAFRRQSESSDPITHKTMLNLGSTALPYEPYGVKIPISSANTTISINLGEVETTRQIRKLVLTGEENITSGHLDVNLFNIPVNDYLKQSAITCISTHYISQSNVNGWADVNDKSATFYGNTGSATKTMYIRDSAYTTVAGFKTYLQQQYANGTPVTIWYVLAEPTTGIVNEPLRKIGDYADTLSMEQAGVQIPTINGENTLDVLTTVKPSEVYIKYKGR